MTGDPLPVVDMESVSCDLCGSGASTPVLTGPDRVSWLGGQFTLVQCQACGLLYQNPRPTTHAIIAFYEGEYHPYVTVIQDERSAIRRWRRRFGIENRCKLILDHKLPGRLLDVGCGTGIFLDTMRRHGWQVQGVELNARAAQYSRDRLGLDVFAGPLEQAHYPDDTFDVVTLWDVLEHLPSPSAALQTFRRILKPDGLLVLRVPNAGSLDARLFGRYWAGWDLPRHYFAYKQQSARRLLDQSGFKVLKVSYEGGHAPFVISCQWCLDERWGSKGRLRSAVDLGLNNLATRLLAAPFLFLTGQVLRRGAVMTFITQQRESHS